MYVTYLDIVWFIKVENCVVCNCYICVTK